MEAREIARDKSVLDDVDDEKDDEKRDSFEKCFY